MKTAPLAMAALLLLGSCHSPKTKALRSLDRITEHALAAQEDAVAVRPHVAEEGLKPFESMVGHVASIAGEATKEARPAVAKLENPPGFFEKLWAYLRWAIIGLVSLAVLFVLGELKVIPGLGWLISWFAKKGLSISRTASHEAALAVDMRYKYGDKSPASEAFIAAKRTVSPSFNGAYMRAKTQFKAKEAV